jgi:glycosyltransferase involved in cell wall biosynthesis
VSCRINAIMPGVTDIVSAVIPCLGEEDAIGAVVASVVAQGVAEVIVVDGASRDRTVERATAAGARVVIEPRRGLQGRDKGAELALKIRSPACRDKMHARIPASSGLFAMNREISFDPAGRFGLRISRLIRHGEGARSRRRD